MSSIIGQKGVRVHLDGDGGSECRRRAYSAAVYVVGVLGVYRSNDAGVTWTRINDDAHQFGGIGVMAADQNIYGRIYASGTGRGVFYSN